MKTIDPENLSKTLRTLYDQAVSCNERPVDVRADVTTSFTRFLRGEHKAGRIAGFGVHCNPGNLNVRVDVWATRSIRWNIDFAPQQ